MVWKISSVLWYLFECWLSHQPGEQSGAESRWLAVRSRTNEKWIRKAAHVLLFAVLGLLAGLGFGPMALVFCAAWSVLDELTKKNIRGRHCSGRDMLLNLSGTALGAAALFVIRSVESFAVKADKNIAAK